MCCEQVECYVAVFDHTEALCYLKGAGATHTYDFVSLDGFTSHEMLFREGTPHDTCSPRVLGTLYWVLFEKYPIFLGSFSKGSFGLLLNG